MRQGLTYSPNPCKPAERQGKRKFNEKPKTAASDQSPDREGGVGAGPNGNRSLTVAALIQNLRLPCAERTEIELKHRA